MPRVFFAGLFHETHSFVDDATGPCDFEIRRGREMLDCLGDASPLGGALEFARDMGWEIAAGADYRALPGGTVDDEVIASFWADILGAWRGEFDAIYLVLHGAMVSASHPDVEGEILGRIRSLPGAARLPVFGVYDLHGNVSPAMCALADGLVAYRENPHADARQAAVRAASLLNRCLETGQRPRMTLRQPGLVWIPGRTGTAANPMAALENAARLAEEQHPGFWAVNVAAGFAYADTPDTGVSFQVVGTADAAETAAALDALEKLAVALDAEAPEIDAIPVAEALASLRDSPRKGLTVLVEPSDNIGGGAPGDMTGLFRALLAAGIENAAICLHDPAAVSRLAAASPGDRLTLELGGKGSRLDPGPVPLEVELVSRSDGRFRLEDPQSHLASLCGDSFDMGPCAVVRHGGIAILLTSNRTPPFDLGQWRSQGIDPENLSVIVVKAAVAHRRVYDPIAARMIWVDTPGPCASDPRSLPFRLARWLKDSKRTGSLCQ